MAGILVTRPATEAADLARQLRALGHTPIIEPLLTIRFADPAPLDLAGVQGLVFTSINGVRAAATRTADRTIPVHAVGTRTAEAAREAGFTRISTAGGDGQLLAAQLAATIDPAAGPLLHVGGEVLAVDLGALLAPAGIRVERVVGYRAVPVDQLSDATVEALEQGAVQHAMFFSPRTAGTFASLAPRQKVVTACARVTALCLSDAVAAALAGIAWREVRIATRRDTSAMLEMLPG